jgi:uncharacterized protein (TIGR02996 family)
MMPMDDDAFLTVLRTHPNDETTRLVYADWLEERDDSRGTFLRLEQEYVALPIDDVRRARLLSRIRRLARSLNRDWLRIVSRPPIENCRLNLKFAFECPRHWDQLQSTDLPTVRSCEFCDEPVYYCDTIAKARGHAARGECVAIDLVLLRKRNDLGVRKPIVGRPSLRMGRLRPDEYRERRPRRRRPQPVDDGHEAPPPRKRKDR